MLKRLKTHHLFKRVPLLSFSTNRETLWKNPPRRRRGSEAQAIGSGDNRRRQIAFLIRSFINPRTCMEGIICNITTSSRFYLMLSWVTVHLSLRKKKNKVTGGSFQPWQADIILIIWFTKLDHILRITRKVSKGKFSSHLCTHTKSPTFLSLFPFVFHFLILFPAAGRHL